MIMTDRGVVAKQVIVVVVVVVVVLLVVIIIIIIVIICYIYRVLSIYVKKNPIALYNKIIAKKD